MSLVKQSGLALEITGQQGSSKIDEVLDFIEDHLPSEETEAGGTVSDVFNFKESFGSVRAYVVERLERLESKRSSVRRVKSAAAVGRTSGNVNRVEHFKLNRCALQSGRILWLCDEHCGSENVQVLRETETVSAVQYQTDEFDKILLNELRKNQD